MLSMKQTRFDFAARVCLLLCLWLPGAALGAGYIVDVTTDKAMYPPGTTATICVDLRNNAPVLFSGSVELAVSHLGDAVDSPAPQAVVDMVLGPIVTKTFSWTPPETDYRGYRVEAILKDAAGRVIDRNATAIDISSDWRRFPRYGYLSRFDAGLDTGQLIRQLRNYHINGLQYYDVGWKHHIPAPPSHWSTWPDVANRTISRSTVTGFTSAARGCNMQSLIYDDWGAAYDDCYSDGSGVTPSMGRFWDTPAASSNQYAWSMPGGWATPRLRLMNNRDPGWQSYICGRLEDAFDDLGFDGWHMDSLITNWQAYDYWGGLFNVYQHNPDFINYARARWGEGAPLVQNLIDGAGLEWMKSANADIIYAELWDGYCDYEDLNRLFDESRRYSGKAVVVAAYLNYNKTSGYFNEPGVRLADAAIFASGAGHIELGDGNAMLYREYFPANGVQMSDSLRSAMRRYYDFLTGYENLLRDDTVSAGGSISASIDGAATSTNGSAASVWTLAKRRPGYNILHLVNLLNNTSTEWRDADGTCPAPPVQTNLPVKLYHTGTIGDGRLWYATPDRNYGAAEQLSFTSGSDAGGPYIRFTVPRLEYWDMIWLEINGRVRADTVIQAEDCDTYSAVGTETCYDSGGGQNVGFVNNVNGDSYLGFGQVNFAEGATGVSARVASELSGGTVEFRLDSPTGPLIATVAVGSTGGWQSWQTKTAPVTGACGIHTLYAVFKGVAGNLNWFTFTLAPDLAPAPPAGLVVAVGDGGVSLDWDDNGEPDLAGYTVYRRTGGGGYAVIASDVQQSEYVDGEAVNGIRYYYVVTAVDEALHESGYSGEVSAIHYAGDLTFDGRVDMDDMARLSGGWRFEYDLDTLVDLAADWLSDAAL